MTKYTKEQREMIAEYLEKEILPMKSLLNQSLPFSALDELVKADDIVDKIKNLRTVTFGDIKNQTGTTFKFKGVDETFLIIQSQETEGNKLGKTFFVINKRIPLFDKADHVGRYRDNTVVEVIND